MKTTPFNVNKAPLKGTHLVEASAGTGKTYNITSLVLRLVAEQDLAIDRILVVTFTLAATAELRDRIRGRLSEARRQLEKGPVQDDVLGGILEVVGDATLVRTRIVEALHGFDGAAVYTMHSFCQRVLRENAFESGTLFDTALVTEQSDLLREAVDDFWRMRVTRLSPNFLAYLETKKTTPDAWRRFAGAHTGARRLPVVPTSVASDADEAETGFTEAVDSLRTVWEKGREEVEMILAEDPFPLRRNTYQSDALENLLQEVDRWLSAPEAGSVLPSKFALLTTEKMASAVKKGCTAPAHEVFELCDEVAARRSELDEDFKRRWIALRIDLLRYVDEWMEQRKARLNVQSFDDLLTRLESALAGPGGPALGARLRVQYPAALIDEFQDTDPVQYRIFEALYGRREDTCLFLVGDPKQSIYGFRGADIFSYLRARALADTTRSLTENWRSASGLVQAVNGVFGTARRPFLFDSIGFEAGAAAAESGGNRKPLDVPEGSRAAMQVWFVPRDENGKVVTKGVARPDILRAVASEAARLITMGREGNATLGGRPLEPRDLAVLVRTHSEAADAKAALAEHGVQGVVAAERNVFESAEAAALEDVLLAIGRPADERLIKGALLTPLFGMTAGELHRLQEDAALWEKAAATFVDYHRQWQAGGFIQMFRRWLMAENVPARILGMEDGERRLTNVLHLGELLEKASLEHPFGPEGLVGWLADRREGARETADAEAELRLESDASRVRIVTVHKSKGLEYPIVFCPFAWEGARGKAKDEIVFHDRDQDDRITLDLGSEDWDAHLVWAQEEDYAEQLRLLYVALTRARHRCYLAWGGINSADTSALGYLLHQEAAMDEARLPEEVKARIGGMTDRAMREDLDRLVAADKGCMAVYDVDDVKTHVLDASASASAELQARTFTGSIDVSWGITSFTALASGRSFGMEQSDRDPLAWSRPAAGPGGEGVHALPGGVATGTLLHKVFEDLSFDATASTIGRVVARHAGYTSLGPPWHPVLAEMVANALHTPLTGGDHPLMLAGIADDHRLNELEFHIPLGRITPGGLSAALPAGAGYAAPGGGVGAMMFEPVRGFMKGYIDLVFECEGRYYLADYKSNRLGPDIDSYAAEGLPADMRAANYVLQYHLYAVALHRHLAARMGRAYCYRDHFGGVFYLFLRGMHPERGPTHGVFFDRPDASLIEALSRYLEEGEPAS